MFYIIYIYILLLIKKKKTVRWAMHGRYVVSGYDDQVILVQERKHGSGTMEFGTGEPPDIENWKVALTLRGHTADVVMQILSLFQQSFMFQPINSHLLFECK